MILDVSLHWLLIMSEAGISYLIKTKAQTFEKGNVSWDPILCDCEVFAIHLPLRVKSCHCRVVIVQIVTQFGLSFSTLITEILSWSWRRNYEPWSWANTNEFINPRGLLAQKPVFSLAIVKRFLIKLHRVYSKKQSWIAIAHKGIQKGFTAFSDCFDFS